MKLIVAGGRNYFLSKQDFDNLDQLPITITEIVSGCATGADAGGEAYAKKHNLPIKRFPPDWKLYGKAAGPMRNIQMAQYADAVVLFPGGKGTESMRREAEKYCLQIFCL